MVGSNGDDTPWFDYYDYDSGTDYTRIFDSGDVQIGASAPECFHPDPDPAPIPQASEDVALCPDGGDAPFLTHLVLELHGGNDDPEFNECFNQVDVDLGEGTSNRATPPPGCAGGVFNVTGGSGPDTVAVDGVASSGMHINANLGAGNDSFPAATATTSPTAARATTRSPAAPATTSTSATAATTTSGAAPATTSRTAVRATTRSAGASASAPGVTTTRAPTRCAAATAPTSWCSRATPAG